MRNYRGSALSEKICYKNAKSENVKSVVVTLMNNNVYVQKKYLCSRKNEKQKKISKLTRRRSKLTKIKIYFLPKHFSLTETKLVIIGRKNGWRISN